MKRRRFSKFALGLIGLFLLAAVSIGPTAYQEFLQQKMIAAFNSGPLRVRAQGMKLGLTSLEAEQISIFLPNLFLELTANKVSSNLNALGLVRMAISADAVATILGGATSFTIERALMSDELKLGFQLTDVNISELPQLNAFGVESGAVSAQSNELIVRPQKLPEGALTFKLSNFDKPTTTSLRGKLIGLNNDIPLPKFTDLNMEGAVQLKSDRAVIDKFTMSSSLGSANGRMAFFFDEANSMKNLEMDLQFRLSDEGAEIFNIARQFLQNEQEREGAKELSKQKNWDVTVRGKSPPRFTFKAAEQ